MITAARSIGAAASTATNGRSAIGDPSVDTLPKPGSDALRDLDRDIRGLDGGDGKHARLQMEFVGGLAAEQ
jgi:hypothetical protein